MKSMRPVRNSKSSGGKVYMYGKHALIEALTSVPKVIKKVFLAPDLDDKALRRTLDEHHIPVSPLSKGATSSYVGKDTAHQGVIALMDPSALLVPLETFLETLDLGKNPAVAVLGEVQDPHNVGAIIRSAAGFGLSAVLIPEHNQAPITGSVVKSSAGMTFRIPLVTIGNVNAALLKLKEKGFWIYGLAMEGTAELGKDTFNAPVAFVIGNEGAGIREKTLETCDVMLSIPMHSRTESLNASVSAGVVFYEWSRHHPERLR